MTTIINGSSPSITFSDNTTQTTAGLPLTGGTITGNVTTAGLTIGTTALGAGNATRFKNRIINGDMQIDQRNSGASVTQTSANALYPVDRFAIYGTSSSKFTAQQNAGSITPPVGFTKYLGITSSAATTVSGGDYYRIYQSIEGLNLTDIAYGTASAKTMTLSFQVYSSLTGTFGGSIYNASANKSYPFSYTISSANTWTTANVTFAGDTASAIATDNTTGFLITWGLGVGSTYGSGTAGAWASGNIMCPSGSTSVVGTSGATFYATGVQLEVGSAASAFEYVDYGTQFVQCQRYYEVGSYRWRGFDNGYTFVGTNFFQVTKRTAPTITNGGAGAASIFVGSFMVTGSGGNFDTGNVAFTASAEL